MSAAIHNYLFAPILSSSDSSARRSPIPNTQTATSSRLRSYLVPSSIPRSPDLEGQDIRTRSPRTPQVGVIESPLSVPDHHHYPSARERKQPTHRQVQKEDKKWDEPAIPSNVPSMPIPREGVRMPRAVMRMMGMLVLMGLAAIMLLRTSTRIPALNLRRMNTGVETSGKTMAYQPPQTVAAGMMNRAKVHQRAARTAHAYAPAYHPIPSSHELLALQSYLLQSDHNILPHDIDPSVPLDGNVILAISPSKLGQQGSSMQKKWLDEIEREREEDIVVWAPAGSASEVDAIHALIGGMTVDSRIPSYIDLEGRSDMLVLGKIMERLGVQVKKTPLVMIGNKVVRGGKKELIKMKDEGKLREELKRIGWLDDWKAREGAEEANEDKEKAPDKVQGKKADMGGKKADIQVKKAEEGENEQKKPRIMNAAFKAH